MNINSRLLYKYLVVVIILGGPIIDLLTGYFINYLNIVSITPGILFRGGIVLPILLFLSCKNRSASVFLVYIGLIILTLSIIYNLLIYNEINVISGLNRFLKIVYPFLGFGALVYIHERKSNLDKKIIWRLGYYCGLITALGVIIFTLFGLGIKSYVHQAYTSSGLFGAANDTGLLILISYCIFLLYNQKYQSKPFLNLSLITPIYVVAALLISTRAPLLGLPAAFFVILGYSLFNQERKMTSFKKAILIGLLLVFILAGAFVVDYLIRNDFVYAINRIQELASGRFEGRNRVANGITFIAEYNIIEHLFGAGEARFALVENDIVDIYGKFGLIFLIVILGTSILFLKMAYSLFLTKRNLASLSLSIALTFYIFHGAVAGHAFTSAQVNNLIIIVYFLIYLYAREQKLQRKLNQLIKRQHNLLNA